MELRQTVTQSEGVAKILLYSVYGNLVATDTEYKSLFVKVLSLNIYVFSLKKLKFTLSVLIDEVIIEVIQTFGFEEMIA